jgi:hypothetical protein
LVCNLYTCTLGNIYTSCPYAFESFHHSPHGIELFFSSPLILTLAATSSAAKP